MTECNFLGGQSTLWLPVHIFRWFKTPYPLRIYTPATIAAGEGSKGSQFHEESALWTPSGLREDRIAYSGCQRGRDKLLIHSSLITPKQHEWVKKHKTKYGEKSIAGLEMFVFPSATLKWGVKGHPRSLKVAPFKYPDMVFWYCSAVTLAVGRIVHGVFTAYKMLLIAVYYTGDVGGTCGQS